MKPEEKCKVEPHTDENGRTEWQVWVYSETADWHLLARFASADRAWDLYHYIIKINT